ncbi:MAG: hypothetical protein ACPG5W_02590 [Flavobacteriales bacterium]
MSSLINNIDRLENDENAGGGPWFQVVLPGDIDSIPDVINNSVGSAITLNSGATAYNIMATVGTVRWSEKPQDAGGRDSYPTTVSFVIPKDRADVLEYAQHLNDKGVVAVVEDANGQKRLLGTKEQPALFRRSLRTMGSVDGERNEHRYEIVLNSNAPIPFYLATAHLPSPANGACPPAPSLTIGVFSDAGLTNPVTSADFNDSIYIRLTTDLSTATSYRFFVGTSASSITLTEQVGATLTWTVSSFNDLSIYAEAENGTTAACALDAFTVTVNADADANAFIAAHNVLSGGTMISAYQEIVQGAYQRLKGSFTTNGSDLWTLIHDNAASRVYPLIPVNGSTVVADAYALDMIHLNEDATYNGMTVPDFATTGVTGSYGKYFLLDKAPSDFDQDSLTLAVYNRSTITAIQSPLGSSETSSHTTNSVLFWPRYSTKAYYQINRNGTNNQTNPDSPGAWVLSRTTSSENSIYKNGSLLAVGSGVSTTPSTKPMMFHSHNKGGTADYSYSGELSFYAQIPGLTAAQAEDLSEIIIWIQTQLGRNV